MLESGDRGIPGAGWPASPASLVSSTLVSCCLSEISILLSNPHCIWHLCSQGEMVVLCSGYKAE